MPEINECALELADIRTIDGDSIYQFADCAMCGLHEIISTRKSGDRAPLNESQVAVRKCPLPENMQPQGIEAAVDAESGDLPILQHD